MLKKTQVCLYFLFSSFNFLIFPQFCCNFSLIFDTTLYSLHIVSPLWFCTIISSILSPFVHFILLFTLFPLFIHTKILTKAAAFLQLMEPVLPDGQGVPEHLAARGQAWHQPSCIWLSSDLNLLSNVETTGTQDLLYQIFWLSLNLLFIKENKIQVLMSIDEDNKDEPQLSHNGLHTHKPSSVFVASVLSFGE